MNTDFQNRGLPISVTRGWQSYDLVVRVNGAAHAYPALIQWATGQADGGAAAAQQFYDWYMNDNVTLGQLPGQLQALAVITHLAEVGRGYSMLVNVNLNEWIESIRQAPDAVTARTRWRTYKESFTPSTTYKEESSAPGTLYVQP